MAFELPLLLAGPILRRTEPTLLTVWAAFSTPQKVSCTIFQNDATDEVVHDGEENSPGLFKAKSTIDQKGTTTTPVQTVAIAEHLHVVAVMVNLPDNNKLKHGDIYYYNLLFEGKDRAGVTAVRDLRTMGLLKDGRQPVNLALGYKTDRLPSFVMPPDKKEDIDKLVFAHGSCRKIHGGKEDLLPHLDKVIADNFDKPDKRPQQLFMTGDQIYADEVPVAVLPFISKLGKMLFGGHSEKIKVEKNNGGTMDVPIEGFLIDGGINNRIATTFPARHRMKFINETAKFTSTGGGHLMSLSEFCAIYLFYWSNRVWDPALTEAMKNAKMQNDKPSKPDLTTVGDLFMDTVRFPARNLATDTNNVDLAKLVFTQTEYDLLKKDVETAGPDEEKAIDEYYDAKLPGFFNELVVSRNFFNKLQHVMRALANVPTYMCFDDHEVTDDWNFTQRWVRRVMQSPAGVGTVLVRNALLSYAVFQDWGNVPTKYLPTSTDEKRKALLSTHLPAYVAEIQTDKVPDPTKASFHIDQLFGLRLPGQTTLKPATMPEEALNEKIRALSDSPDTIKWHYDVPTGFTKTLILDTRTRRVFPGDFTPPGLLTVKALADQLLAAPSGNPPPPVVFIVSPVPVMGLTMLEELAQPMVSLAQGGFHSEGGEEEGIISGRLKRDMESWSFNTDAIERLLEKVAALKTSVVFLSGDVHFGFSTLTDYWKKGTPPVRIIQLTCSGFKNIWMDDLALFQNSFTQNLLSGFDSKIEKHGWRNAAFTYNGKITPQNRIRARQKPVVLATSGWFPETTVSPDPEWQWRMQVGVDEREDPENARITLDGTTVVDLNPAAKDKVPKIYNRILNRYHKRFVNGTSRRLVWDTQMSVVRFVTEAQKTRIVNEFFYYATTDNGEYESAPKSHTVHKIPLKTEDPTPPLKLGTK